MKRIAIVVQRYGADINGGAELHARLLARALRDSYQVDVLTSRAKDYRTWAPHYALGEDSVEGCRVLRFDHPRHDRGPDRHMPLRPKLRWKLRRWLQSRAAPLVMQPTGNEHTDGLRYLRAQGPTMDSLMDYLREHGGDYAAILCMTALYHPTALGVLVRPERSILVPTLHDEKAMYLPHFHRVFRAPRCILFNTAAEAAVARRLYGDDIAPGVLCGVGIDLPPLVSDAGAADRWAATAAQHRIDGPYILYVGRIDVSKGCADLFADFLRWRRARASALKLVVVGQSFMTLMKDPALIYTDFVADAQRDALLAHAEALVVPSRYESLSLVALEAMAHGCPVIVNRHSEVLMHHVQDSGVGAGYADYDEFAVALDAVLATTPAARAERALRARDYVQQRYAWPRITAVLREAIEAAAVPPGAAAREARP